MKTVLLTGASGFVGSHVLRHILATTDWNVVCLVSFRHRGLTDRIRLAVSGYDEDFNRVKVIKHDLTAPISPVLSHEIGTFLMLRASHTLIGLLKSPSPLLKIMSLWSVIC